MRTDIVHIGASELTYEIRNIVKVTEKLQQLGVKINAENIGDPVTKGEKIPNWMKTIIVELAMDDSSYGYCATQGVPETRGQNQSGGGSGSGEQSIGGHRGTVGEEVELRQKLL